MSIFPEGIRRPQGGKRARTTIRTVKKREKTENKAIQGPRS